MKIFLGLFLALATLSAQAKYKNQSKGSANITGGNSDLKTYTLETKNGFEWTKNHLDFNVTYLYGEANKVRSTERWSAQLKWTHDFSKRWGFFISELVEADRFAGVKRRYNTDIGAKWTPIKTDKHKLFFEGGYRYTLEEVLPTTEPDRRQSKSRLFGQYNRKLSETVSSFVWVEHFFNFSVPSDYQINASPGLDISLNKIFSLQTSYLWNYDNLPAPGNGKHDYQFLLSLVAKIE